MTDVVATLIGEVRKLRLANEDLERRLGEAQLRSIEALNPGIDMDEVRRLRQSFRVDL